MRQVVPCGWAGLVSGTSRSPSVRERSFVVADLALQYTFSPTECDYFLSLSQTISGATSSPRSVIGCSRSTWPMTLRNME